MEAWLAVVVVIVVVLAAGLLRDSLRTGAVNRWCRERGIVFVLQPEHDRERLIGWAERFRPYNASHWGIVLRGDRGTETIVAEHREKPRSGPERWHTLVATRVPGLRSGEVRITRAPSEALRRVTDAIIEPGRQARTRLAIEVSETPVVHPVGGGTWAVEVANHQPLSFWTSASQAAAIDAWSHDAELAAVDDFVIVRVPGLISASNLDRTLAITDAARVFFTQAAERMRARS